MKAGNSLEDKTGMSSDLIQSGHAQPKASVRCEGEK